MPGATRKDPPAETVVHLLRHAEVHNPGGVLYGRLPGFALSAAGVRMAGAAGAFLAACSPAAIYVSPLRRARQTAEPLEALTGLPARVDYRLIESRSVFEGMPAGIARALLTRPGAWRHVRNPFRPSWGEPYETVALRMLAAVADARDAHPGRHVVAVSHQLPIWVARRAFEERPLWHRPDRRQCALASVTSLVFVGRRFLRVDYTETVPSGEQAVVGA